MLKNLFNTSEVEIKEELLNKRQWFILLLIIVLSLLFKVLIIPCNMMDMGDSATRVWNALWWAEKPFFVMPVSGNPLWFYFMGSLIMVTKEIFYTPIITMILLMTVSGYYLFRITHLLFGFKAGVFTYIVFTLCPAIFRLNFEPYALQLSHVFICGTVFYLLKGVLQSEGKKYLVIAGIMSFFALASRPEAIFVIVPLCAVIFLTKERGRFHYIEIAILFQLLWIAVSLIIYGKPFETFQAADEYTDPVNIQSLSLPLRMKGFFLPYYFLVLGFSFFVFYYLVKGLFYSWKSNPKAVTLILVTVMLSPALINGIAGAKSIIYHTTHYIYLMFFIGSVFAGAGLFKLVEASKKKAVAYIFCFVIILSAIPLSYIKEFVPEKYNKLFPKVIQFVVTTDEPGETRKLIKFIDENIEVYPSLIFDSDDNTSAIYYVPFRTKLAPPEKVLISSYNVPKDMAGLRSAINGFMVKNKKGIIMFRKNKTVMNEIFSETLFPLNISRRVETDKWIISVYE